MSSETPLPLERNDDEVRGGRLEIEPAGGSGSALAEATSLERAPESDGDTGADGDSVDLRTDDSAPFPATRVFLVILSWSVAMWTAIGLSVGTVIPGGWPSLLGLALLCAGPSLVFLRHVGGALQPSATLRRWVFRPFWYVQLGLPLVALASLVALMAGLPFGRAGAVGRGGVALATCLYALLLIVGYIGSRRLVTRRLELEFPDLPKALDGLRVAQISDLHVGPQTSRKFLARINEAIVAARPEVIVLTGDQVDDFGNDVAVFAETFGELSAPLGVFAVAGNHDVYAGWRKVRRGMERMGISVLVNEALCIEHNGGEFWIAGTGDPAGTQWKHRGGALAAPDIDRTVAGIPKEAFVIGLAHNPVLWPQLAEHGVQLTLSGHTHHGQISIPVLRWSLASPFLDLAMGLHRRGASWLYIHPGTNFWGVPLRVGALPEVTIVTLRRGVSQFATL